jgi:hypothetical protein
VKIFRHLTTTLVTFSAIIGASAFVFAVVVTFVVSAFRDVEISAWNVVATQIARWFLFWAGVYVIHNVLPIAVAHGRTRREFLLATSGFTVVLSLVLALLAWLGFLVEGGIYSLMDWRAGEHGSPLAYFLMFLVWCAVGAFVAAAYNRFGPYGLLSFPAGLVLAVVAGVKVPGSGELPYLPDIPVALGAGWHAVSLLAFVIALAGTWVVARTMPIRPRTT